MSGRGAGIVAQPAVHRALRDLGIDTADLGVEMTTRKILDAEGRTVIEARCPQTLTAWERLYRLLRDAFPADRYHRGVGLKRLRAERQLGDGAFQRRQQRQRRSSDRRRRHPLNRAPQLLPDLHPLYAGYVAWRVMLPERAIPPVIHRELFESMTFCLPPGEQFLGYPVAGPDNDLRLGHRRYNVVWYRPADERTELQRLLTDESGVTHAISIPPPLIRRQAIEEMRAAAERLVAPQFRAIARLMDEPVLQPIYDLETPRMAFGRIAIIGDAAFVARPHVGAGVSKASDDALALAEAVAEGDVEPALRAFEAQRLSVGRRIIERARHLGAYLQAYADRGGARPSRALQHGTGGDRGNRAGGFPRRVECADRSSPRKRGPENHNRRA